MAERGIDIAGEYPKPCTDEVVRAADVVITMEVERRVLDLLEQLVLPRQAHA